MKSNHRLTCLLIEKLVNLILITFLVLVFVVVITIHMVIAINLAICVLLIDSKGVPKKMDKYYVKYFISTFFALVLFHPNRILVLNMT